jgi:nitrogen fixation protein FixH
MFYTAVVSFPGTAGTDGFDLSNGYKRVLDAVANQAALGWRIQAALDDTRRPVLYLTDKFGAPLTTAEIEAHAERPIGPVETTRLAFRPAGEGRFQADTTLFSGQWDIMLTVRANGQSFNTTQRVVAR